MCSLKEKLARLNVDLGEVAVTDGSCAITFQALQDIGASMGSDWLEDEMVALCFGSQADLIRAVVALDGRVAGLLLLSPDLNADDVKKLMSQAGANHLLSDRDELSPLSAPWKFVAKGDRPGKTLATKWLMTTSGTTGLPKIVPHSLDSLSASVKPNRLPIRPVWGLLYEGSRFAGMQVILQSLLAADKLITIDRQASFAEQIGRLVASSCTHLSATTSMWRKILMLPASQQLPLKQITLGGDIADHRTLIALASAYPEARITHIYASTEIGVGFSVHDGLPGFPRSYLSNERGALGVGLRVNDGMLWAKPRTPRSENDLSRKSQQDGDGFFCTGDCVETTGDRVLFRGRVDTVANIGGTKVAIEVVEDLVRQHSSVLDCKVLLKPSPILGTVLALQVVARDPDGDEDGFRTEIRKWCKDVLPREARPATVSIVRDLQRNSAGKLARL